MRRFLLRLLAFVRAGRADAELSREIAVHLRLLEDAFIAHGMTAEQARSAARRAFGGVEQVKERQRNARSFGSIDAWWLDLKLGARMLIKYPGLTIVGGLGLAVAIAIVTPPFAVFYGAIHPTLPLDEGERIVGLESWDTLWNNQEHRILHDFVTWRGELTTVQDLGAFRMIQRNVMTPHGRSEEVSTAEITASGFRVARVPPLLGRSILEQDEKKGAPPVAVLGYDVWRTRFGADPKILGQRVRVGDRVHGDRRHAGRVRLPGEPAPLDAPAGRPVRRRATAGTEHHPLRSARSGYDDLSLLSSSPQDPHGTLGPRV